MTAPTQPAIETLARRFHGTYERLAPEFGYATRRESAVAWEDVPERNRALMVATIAEVLSAVEADLRRKEEALTLAERLIAVFERDDRHGNLEMHQEDALEEYRVARAALTPVSPLDPVPQTAGGES